MNTETLFVEFMLSFAVTKICSPGQYLWLSQSVEDSTEQQEVRFLLPALVRSVATLPSSLCSQTLLSVVYLASYSSNV